MKQLRLKLILIRQRTLSIKKVNQFKTASMRTKQELCLKILWSALYANRYSQKRMRKQGISKLCILQNTSAHLWLVHKLLLIKRCRKLMKLFTVYWRRSSKIVPNAVRHLGLKVSWTTTKNHTVIKVFHMCQMWQTIQTCRWNELLCKELWSAWWSL